MSNKSNKPALFVRHADNPILTAGDWPYQINTVFNAGATRLHDGTHPAALPGGGPARHLPPLRGPIRQWH